MNISFTMDTYNTLSWYYRVLIVITCLTLITYIFSIITSSLHKALARNNHPIKNIVLTSVRPPLYFFMIAMGFSIALHIIATEFKWHHEITSHFKIITIVVSIVWFFVRLIDKMEAYLALRIKYKQSKLDSTALGALTKVAYITIFVLASLISMEALGFSVSGILAFGGVSGVIMGFASKDILANVLGAITIYSDKPFKVGDWIRLQEKNIEGHVEKIGLRCTIIRSLEKRPIYVPNSIFSIVPIENPSQMSHRQINETFGIRHEDFSALKQILHDINVMLAENTDIDKKQICSANFTGFTPTSVNLTILCFTKAVDYADFFNVKERLLIAAAAIIEKHEAKMAQLQIVKSGAL